MASRSFKCTRRIHCLICKWRPLPSAVYRLGTEATTWRAWHQRHDERMHAGRSWHACKCFVSLRICRGRTSSAMHRKMMPFLTTMWNRWRSCE